MALSSVQTNVGAMVALQSLNTTESQLASTQKQIATGYRVADASDDGAAFAIAQSIRSTVGSLTTANQQLGNVQGLLTVTQTGLTSISKTMVSMRNVLLNLATSTVTGNTRSQYVSQYQSLLTQVKNYVQDSSYEGKTLIGNITSVAGVQMGNAMVARNDAGATYGIYTMSGSSVYNGLCSLETQTSTQIQIFLSATAPGASTNPASGTVSFSYWQSKVGTDLNAIGNNINFVNNQITFNNNKIDALNSGLGSLIDANLAQESAQLTALQIRQQLGTQALSLANQAPQTLLSLFK
jgi:flagellin